MNKAVYIAYMACSVIWIVIGFTVLTPVLSCIKGITLYAYPGFICLQDMESENRLNIGIGLSAAAIMLTLLSFLFYQPLYSGTVMPVLFFAWCVRQKKALRERNEVAGIYVEEDEYE